MKVKYAAVLVVAAVALFAYGCGGGGTPEEEGGGGLEGINNLSDIPDSVLDPKEYDQSISPSAMVVAKDVKAQVGGSQFSRAGCETDRMKKNIIRNAVMPRMILCNIKAMETAAGTPAAGDGTYNYWKFSPPEGVEGPPGADAFAPRVAIKKDGSTLTFVMCNGTTQAMELVISTADNVYSGHVIDKWGDGFNGKLEFNADGTPDSFTTATFTQSMVEASNIWHGFGSASLQATPDYSIVEGFFNEDNPVVEGAGFSGATYAKFDATQGTAAFRADSGSYPGATVQQMFDGCVQFSLEGGCGASVNDWLDPITGWLNSGNPCALGVTADDVLCFQPGENCPAVDDGDGLCPVPDIGTPHHESFTIALNDATADNPYDLLFTMAATSDYEADVLAATLPSSSNPPEILFTITDVDCSGSDDWSDIPFVTEPNMDDCVAMEQELNQFESGDVCAQQDSEATTEEQFE